MSVRERVVFDCNVFFQAVIRPQGPAAMCLEAARKKWIDLHVSEYIFEELLDVCMRPPLVRKFKFTIEQINNFILEIRSIAIVIDEIPHVFSYERDPDDEHYIDLAAACQAHLIASRDRDLLALNDLTTEAGRQFHAQFPDLLILQPEELLARIRDV